MESNSVFFIIDSNSTYRNLTCQYLQKAGFCNIYKYSTIEDCIGNLKLNPDLIITEFDTRKGLNNGFSFLKYIKAHHRGSKMIFLSSNNDKYIGLRAIKNGALEYIAKSKVALNELIYVINHYDKYRNNPAKDKSIEYKLIASISILLGLLISMVILYKKDLWIW